MASAWSSHALDVPIDRSRNDRLLSPWLALGCSILYTVLYIAPFYLSATLRATPLNSRDAPHCIRARIRAVGLTCLACTTITIAVLYLTGTSTSLPSLAHHLGIYPVNIPSILSVLCLALVLFSCSLYERLFVLKGYSRLTLSNLLSTFWTDLRNHRNHLIAPLSEELVFRSLSVPLYLAAGVSPKTIVFAAPLVFGLAHAHHLVEFLQTYTPRDHVWWAPPGRVLLPGLARTVFQFTYTSLFGFFAVFVFLRTGSFGACVVVHAFCNFMGLPRLWGRVGVDEDDEEDEDEDKDDVAVSPVLLSGAESSAGNTGQHPASSRQRASIIWTVVYYTLVPVGMYGFEVLLWPWTESEFALAAF